MCMPPSLAWMHSQHEGGDEGPCASTPGCQQKRLQLDMPGKPVLPSDVETGQRDAPSVRSIYSTFGKRQRWLVLVVVATTALLVPFSNVIYLPALPAIAEGLHTSHTMVTATISVYLFLVGGSALVWGPFCDRYGRRPTLLLSLGIYTAASTVCAVTPNVEVLILFRAFQGAAVSGLMPAAQAVVADVFPPDMRGTASGLILIPVLLGPLLGPLLGGGLTQALGWRSAFVCLIVMSSALACLVFTVMPETHQWYHLRRIEREEPGAAAQVLEAPDIPVPVFRSPLNPLAVTFQRNVVLHILMISGSFAFFFCCVTVLPIALAKPPFGLTSGFIGLTYLPSGISGVLVAPLAGRLCDMSTLKFRATSGGLLPALLFQVLLMPPALFGFGWALQRGSLAGALACLSLASATNNASVPAVFSWISIMFQSEAGGALAGMSCVMFTSMAVFVQVATPAVVRIGTGRFFSILGGIQLLLALAAALRIIGQIKRERQITGGPHGAGGTQKRQGAAAAGVSGAGCSSGEGCCSSLDDCSSGGGDDCSEGGGDCLSEITVPSSRAPATPAPVTAQG